MQYLYYSHEIKRLFCIVVFTCTCCCLWCVPSPMHRHAQILELKHLHLEASRRAVHRSDSPTQRIPISHPSSWNRDRHNAEVLLRLLRCVPHTRQHERTQSAQQRSQPPAQRPGLLRADLQRPDTASHQQYHRRIQLGGPSESALHSKPERRISRRTDGAAYGHGRADGDADARWFPAARCVQNLEVYGEMLTRNRNARNATTVHAGRAWWS